MLIAACVGPPAIFVFARALSGVYSNLPLVDSWLLTFIAVHTWSVAVVSALIGCVSALVVGTVVCLGYVSKESERNVAAINVAFAWVIPTSALTWMHLAMMPNGVTMAALDIGVCAGCYLVGKFGVINRSRPHST